MSEYPLDDQDAHHIVRQHQRASPISQPVSQSDQPELTELKGACIPFYAPQFTHSEYFNNNNNNVLLKQNLLTNELQVGCDAFNNSPLLLPSSGESAPPGRGYCAGCKTLIQDRYFLKAVDSFWHLNCLRCAVCKLSLETEPSCYAKNGTIYCRKDYFKIYSSRSCARCGISISGSEMVMKVRDLVFHLGCFSCARCQRLLHTGEIFGMRGPLPYCQDELGYFLEAGNPPGNLFNGGPPGLAPPAGCFPVGHPANLMRLSSGFFPPVPSSFDGQLHKGRGKKKRGDHDDCYDRPGDEYCLGSPPRQKRMRTSFKHHQLRTMKAYFSLNHNPDAKDLKSLAEKTGLSKRVLQVWFQNARAKYRRSQARSGDSQSNNKPEGDDEQTKSSNNRLGDDGASDSGNTRGRQNGSPELSLDDDDTVEEDMLFDDDHSGAASPISELSLSPNAEFAGSSMGGQTGTDSDTAIDNSLSTAHITKATAALYSSC